MSSIFWLSLFISQFCLSFKSVYGAANSSSLQTMPYGWDESGKYFASVWDSKVKGSYTAKGDKAGTYAFEWHGVDDAIVAKGFRNGRTDRVISYDGSFQVEGNGAYLSLYGWSVGTHCVEYYIIDNFGEFAPCGPGAKNIKGTFESDGDLYTFCTTPGGAGCIDKKGKSHVQYISRRHTKRTSGTITFANHVNAWKNAGMILGSLETQPQVIATEAYAGSSGSAKITISEGPSKQSTKNVQTNENTSNNDNTKVVKPNDQEHKDNTKVVKPNDQHHKSHKAAHKHKHKHHHHKMKNERKKKHSRVEQNENRQCSN